MKYIIPFKSYEDFIIRKTKCYRFAKRNVQKANETFLF